MRDKFEVKEPLTEKERIQCAKLLSMYCKELQYTQKQPLAAEMLQWVVLNLVSEIEGDFRKIVGDYCNKRMRELTYQERVKNE